MQPELLWQPGDDYFYKSNLIKYYYWLKKNKGLEFSRYEEAWKWSTENPADFWESISQYFNVIHHTPYTKVMSDDPMPGTKWFEGSTLNYSEHIFRNYTDEQPAIIHQTESRPLTELSWAELRQKVTALQNYFKNIGLKKGDRVVAYLPNTPEATIAFLAVNSLGAIWSSCSPDFGTSSVVDRFQQIEPKVLIAVDGYHYGGKSFSKVKEVQAICEALNTLEKVVYIPFLNENADKNDIPNAVLWSEALSQAEGELTFEAVPFDHPIWVLYSSGTTGIPKAITHCHGGVLLEHFKYLAFHNDVRKGEHFFWFSTTGWMMWNFVQASLLVGATVVLYDGSPGYPNLNIMWEFIQKAKINHFGTSAPFLVACMKAGMTPQKDYDFSHLRSIGSTGAPLPPEAFHWVYENVKKDIWLCSMSGGTDVCTAFVGGCPTRNVYMGEIQCRGLGVKLEAFNPEGQPVLDEVGEMVITVPMPSMPIYFWNDENQKRYRSSYFEMYPGIWRHGDWIKITERDSLIIYGRSDATLNRMGVRIGTSEIYRAVNKISEVKDSMIINIEKPDGRDVMPLFVVMNEGHILNDDIKTKIKRTIRSDYSPRHVPDDIISIPEIPYTISGKKLETPVKRILMGMAPEKAANKDSMKNPSALNVFIEMVGQL